ncbi:MAG TPA: isoprenylcysteine carboxylmethyltransferase family protein [Terriglobales bacterium]|nr:isoprenylcysteine carboxylmethyltransferase family protein [Terriglobales bacterium]
MRQGADPVVLAAFAAVMVCWLIFGLVFLLRRLKPTRGTPEVRRNRRSIVGMVLQGLAYGLIWVRFRPAVQPIVTMPLWADIVVAAVAVVIAATSIWLVITAVRALGKQWALGARLIQGHELITSGPYALVRNPIYSGMFGMLLATGLVATRWPEFLIAIAIFLLGTVIRVRIEENLLRHAFGAEFDNYAHRVPALIPGVY